MTREGDRDRRSSLYEDVVKSALSAYREPEMKCYKGFPERRPPCCSDNRLRELEARVCELERRLLLLYKIRKL